MGLIDAFSKEDRVDVTFSSFYELMKTAARSELLLNAVNCDVPHEYIREMASGVRDGKVEKVEGEDSNQKKENENVQV